MLFDLGCCLKINVGALSLNRFTLVVSLFFVFIFNIPLFEIVKEGIDKQQQVNWLFIATIPVFLVAALSLIFSLFSVKYLVKPFYIILTLISSCVFFASYKYNIIFDSGMIENIFETNQSEAMTYVNFSSIVSFILTGVLPSIYILKVNIIYKPFWKELRQKLYFMLGSILIIVLIAMTYFQNYVAFGRNNDTIKHYVVPTYFIGSLVKYINVNYLLTPLKYEELGLDAKVTKQYKKPNLLVLVVGETARSKNYHLYGYERDTNPFTTPLGVIPFREFTSCGTATAVSLPCMFSRLGRKDYDHRKALAQDTLIDVVAHAGINVDWLDNDSGCKGVCLRVKHLTISHDADLKECDGSSCYDQVLVNRLHKVLAADHAPKNTLIVLHLMGSHGPTYYKRYPKNKREFIPDCERSDIQNCTHEQLINTYDNTIAYTDFVLSEVINTIRKQNSRFNTAMIYLSDHGESLGEKGMYLHGAPYAFAPNEQTHIPFFLWLSQGFSDTHQFNLNCIKKEAQKGGYSQDNLFDTVLGLLDISTKVYDPNLDMLATCRAK